MRNGQILRGEVIQQTATTMQIRMEDGKIRQLNKKEIQRVSYKAPTEQEKKESEEKLKQAPVVELPPIVEIVPPTPIIQEEKKLSGPYDIDQTKRKDIEAYFGIGYGTYQPASETFANHLAAKFGNISGSAIDANEPEYKRGKAHSFGATYYFKKFSFGLSNNVFNGETSTRIKSYNSATSFQEFYGTYPESQSILKGDISYLAFTNERFDLRPSIGYSQVWGNTDDKSTTSVGYEANSINSVFKYTYRFLENLRGPSIGLKATIRMKEKWEHRLELHYLTLTGEQHSSGTGLLSTANSSTDFILTGQETTWRATGFNFSYKLFYRLTPTLSIWAGIQNFEWKYTISSYGQSFDSLGSIQSPSPPEQMALINILLSSFAKSEPATSKSSSLEFGVMKRFELNN
ncbi:hypothetical protein EHQ64_07110 [Leptospira sarikeiensis]|uniref:Porin n=2 Tax=Leptospira sarikeiensis TaxID=2484943 RepID=A0A4R9KCX2_9LEPT|nr:hypothetical protein EHQ64_07110 [Leptospira sarikeiensis]